jgi:hypothetical protein
MEISSRKSSLSGIALPLPPHLFSEESRSFSQIPEGSDSLT